MGVPILAFGNRDDLLRRIQLLHAVNPVSMHEPADLLPAEGWATKGDSIVCVYGERRKSASMSNLVYVHKVGSF